jgi:flavin reductase (DIM6/NTAB) family NADH-FMN oxidoreductase RutF
VDDLLSQLERKEEHIMKHHVLTLVIGLAALLLASAGLAADAPVPFQGPELTDLYMSIEPEEIGENPIRLIGKDWMLITAGTPENFNTMTASWGGYGMWRVPVAYILVHPARYTFQFLEKEEIFTLSFYDPAAHRDVLGQVFGGTSGRTTDKVKESGFTPMLAGPGIAYAEARMIIVCKQSFATNTDPEGKSHRLYFGEILSVWVRK